MELEPQNWLILSAGRNIRIRLQTSLSHQKKISYLYSNVVFFMILKFGNRINLSFYPLDLDPLFFAGRIRKNCRIRSTDIDVSENSARFISVTIASLYLNISMNDKNSPKRSKFCSRFEADSRVS